MGSNNFGYIPEVYEKMKSQERIEQIVRLSSLARNEFLSRYGHAGLPVIFRRESPSTKILNSTILHTLANTLGNKEVDVRPPDYSDPVEYSVLRISRKMKLRDFVEQINRNTGRDTGYAANNKLEDDELPCLGIEKPCFYPESYLQNGKLWLGPEGVITPLHADGLDNFVIQMMGRKRWQLFPVRDYPYLSMFVPKPDAIPNFHASRFDIRNVDLTLHPDFRKAKSIEFILCAGETLYIPAGWAHFVETLDISLTINFWTARHIKPAVLR